MSHPTPAIVAQHAVRPLPRLGLIALCLAYVLPGFLGRAPWKNADMAAFGVMWELAQGQTAWMQPMLAGQRPEFDALLPYWLGAWAIGLAPSWLAPDFAARVPFGLLLGLAIWSLWYAAYHLARSPAAQPLSFAFGGEAHYTDYARAIADGAVLALLACLGLALLSHEATPSVAQLASVCVALYGFASLPHRPLLAPAALGLGLLGLALSGAPTLAAGLGALAFAASWTSPDASASVPQTAQRLRTLICLLMLLLVGTSLSLWQWRITPNPAWLRDPASTARLFVWFLWPAWLLALWSIWWWRRQIRARHVLVPLGVLLLSIASAMATAPADRSLLLGLPGLALLAAFALPTIRHQASALVDWFTLLFFSGCAFVIWVVWISLQTGVPAQPAANVARLAPGFVPTFHTWAFVPALAATLAWAWLVRWRTRRHREVIWKSLVLPAGGATLCWLLLTTLWMPLLDYARGYQAGVEQIRRHTGQTSCVAQHALPQAQVAALRYWGGWRVVSARPQGKECDWLVTDLRGLPGLAKVVERSQWQEVTQIRRPTDAGDRMVLLRRIGVG